QRMRRDAAARSRRYGSDSMPNDAFSRSQILEIGAVQTYVAEAGQGPDVVLLHGNPDTHAIWSDVARRLSPTHRTIAPDLPGFGHSRAPATFDCSLENMAAWVGGLLDGLRLERAHLVVHDVGGPYGLAFAALQPERLRSLSIFN